MLDSPVLNLSHGVPISWAFCKGTGDTSLITIQDHLVGTPT
jgi:hypothetical protein